MARARNIKPGFFKNEELADLGAEAMVLFAGLWTIADREGRLEDRPKRIRAEVLPYWPKVNIDALLQSLADSGFILRYTIGDERYIAIPKWSLHQNPHVKEAVSKIPAPAGSSASPIHAPDEHSASTEPAQKIPERAGLIPSSLIPDSHTHNSAKASGVVALPLPMRQTPLRQPTAADGARAPSQQFETVWALWPRKVGRDSAARDWLSLCHADDDEEILACVQSYLASAEVARGAIRNLGSTPDRPGWLVDCAREQWACRWPRAAPQQSAQKLSLTQQLIEKHRRLEAASK